MRIEKPKEARELLKEVKASLLPGEMYYQEADELISQLAPTAPLPPDNSVRD